MEESAGQGFGFVWKEVGVGGGAATDVRGLTGSTD